MEPVDLARTLRRLEPSGWAAAARRFTTALRDAGHEPGRLLVVGTPEAEPWHLTAHLDDAARWQGVPALRPVLVRREVPAGAPPHLSIGLDAVHRAGPRATVLVAAPSAADDDLLDRLDDARRSGAALLALHPGGGPLDDLVRERLLLPPVAAPPEAALDLASHVVATPQALRRRRWSLR